MPALGQALTLQTKPFFGGLDADAAAGIAAVLAAGGTLTGAQQTALNTAVVAMKAASIWTKLYRWWPIVGANSSGHLIDFKTGTAQATNVNSPTHDASGCKSNGTTSYMSTTVTPNDLGAVGSLGVSLKEPRISGIKVPVGSNGSGIFRLYFSASAYHYYGQLNYTTAADAGAGNWAVVRESSTVLKSMKNGAVNDTLAAVTTVGSSTRTFFLLADNVAAAATNFCDLYCTNFWLGTTMVQADVTTLSGIINTLEAAFGR